MCWPSLKSTQARDNLDESRKLRLCCKPRPMALDRPSKANPATAVAALAVILSSGSTVARPPLPVNTVRAL
ncbi:hypothetical protein D9M70_627190 [compost metagenome]